MLLGLGLGPTTQAGIICQLPVSRLMHPLTIFGLFAVTSMVVCYACEDRSPNFILAFAISCLLGSAYGFLQGAWPFGAVELVWSGIALHRWRKTRR